MPPLDLAGAAPLAGAARADKATGQALVPRPVYAPGDTFVRDPAPVAAQAPGPALPTLLFNDACAVCRTLSTWVRESEAKDPKGVDLLLRPICEDPDALKALHPSLTIWDAYATVHVLMPDGSMKLGGEAVAEVLRRLPNTAGIAKLLDVEIFGGRPFQALLNAGYYVLDKTRPALGCESCGEPPPLWARPIGWLVQGYQALFGKKPEQAKPDQG